VRTVPREVLPRPCWSENLRWSTPRQSARPTLTSAVSGATAPRFIAINMIRLSRCEWRNRFGRCFPPTLLSRRGPSRRRRRFAAAAAGFVPPPDQHSRKERYERRWWRPSATGTRNTTAFSCRGLAAWMPGTQFATTLIACSNAGAAFLVGAGTSFFPTLAPWFASTLLSAG